MSELTYGDRAEQTATTLLRLIGVDAIPTDQADITRLLQCREARPVPARSRGARSLREQNA